jgi:copper homeostasis protein CutC
MLRLGTLPFSSVVKHHIEFLDRMSRAASGRPFVLVGGQVRKKNRQSMAGDWEEVRLSY